MVSKIITVFSALLASVAAVPAGKFGSISKASANSDWDYIVVGGGPAGIIVSERLAEQNHKVLLLERGGPTFASTGGNATTSWDTNGLTPYDVPSQNGEIFAGGYSSTCPDTAGLAGCLLGGGVSINAMVFVHPPEHDFDDRWPEGWKWADIQPSAAALYSRNPGTIAPSMDGKWYDTAEYEVLSSFLTTQNFTSVNPIEDPDSKTKVFSHPPWNIKDGLRAGPVRTYLPLAEEKSGFTLQMYSNVLRVVRSGSTITGVEVEDANTGVRSIISICSTGRVVLAAGSMTTPRLLINSGIGPTAQIEIVQNGTANVTLPDKNDWINLPVGTEIKDHPIINVYFNTTANLTIYPFLSPSAADKAAYLANRTTAIAQGTQRLIFWDSFTGSDGIVRNIQGTTSISAAKTLLVKFYLTHGLQSVGSLSVTSTGATELTTTPYFTNEVDRQGLASYIDSFISATSSTTGSGIVVANDTATGDDYITNSFAAGDHYVGTAKIGDVVDTDTKVIGTDNLFAVDASIHADLPTGNTQAIVMVVAEKAAQKILALN